MSCPGGTPVGAPRVEFDLSCQDDSQYFKSSFAKSMALRSEHQSKSLDCSALNAALRARDPDFGRVRTARNPRGGPDGGGTPLAAAPQQQQQQQQQQPNRRAKEDGHGHSEAGKELARLRKELQNLQEENRRLQASTAGRPDSASSNVPPDTADMVDHVLLQNQVDTLQWQLRQTESSRHMYRAVMEQVVRFLERAHRNLKLAASNSRPKTPNGRVPRSRSVHTVDAYPGGRASPRDSLPDFQRAKSITQIEDSQSYSAFRDFTWRRPRPSQSDLEEVPPEKLSQEAFRLLRTVQSLLNTREPDLAHRLSGSGSGSGSGPGSGSGDSEPRSERSSVVSLDQADDGPQSLLTNGSPLVTDGNGALSLRRKHNIRNSQVVSCASYNRLREAESHSNSSTTEDGDYDTAPTSLVSGLESCLEASLSFSGPSRLEEARQARQARQALRKQSTPQPSLSSAEDESGFSSMGSFQEVGLPLLSSTQMGAAANDSWRSQRSQCSQGSQGSRGSRGSQGSFHEVGLPLHHHHHHGGKPPVPIHRRWSSNPVEAIGRYPAYKGAEALRVLWV